MNRAKRSDEASGGFALDEPAVDADTYDRAYFLHGCMGADAWRASDGREIDPMYGAILDELGFAPGDRLLDVGCGRGELVRVAAERGARRAAGVDYSEDAVALAARTLESSDATGTAEVAQADARRLPFKDAAFDHVTMLDVVEHLTPPELDRALAEAGRVLAPGGTLYVHTAPNRLIYDVTYRLQRLARPSRLRTWPRNPRNDLERAMHVNEQTLGSLRRAVRTAGFEKVRCSTGAWVYTAFVPDERAKVTYQRLSRLPYLRRLAVCDLFLSARAPLVGMPRRGRT